ncbi:MAG: arginine decarboxylase [Candidatus Aminicenantes bacterium]|nr:arginine decarboxylase [Candidatus Aminicenantes bacterium]
MNAILPVKMFLTRGCGQHKEKLVSFEKALREAGINPFNLVKVSSIFPPGCALVGREEGLKLLHPGQIVFLVMSENATDEAHRLISASIGMAIPKTGNSYGYLAEHEGFGQSEKDAGRYTEGLAAEMLATKLGRRFDGPAARTKDGHTYRLSGTMSVTASSITQTANGSEGLWTTAIAAAVFVT